MQFSTKYYSQYYSLMLLFTAKRFDSAQHHWVLL